MTIDLNVIEKAALAATPGPWLPGTISLPVLLSGQVFHAVGKSYDSATVHAVVTGPVEDIQSGVDAAFIAAANPAAVLEMVKYIASIKKQRDELLVELEKAHQIIRNGLNCMDVSAKLEWGAKNRKDGCIGEGTTRANEREALIAKAKGGAL